MLEWVALLWILAWAKARSAAPICAAISAQRATPASAKINATVVGARQKGSWRRRSVVTARPGDAPPSLPPSASTRDPLQYFNSLLTLGNALSNVSLVFRKIRSDDRQIELPQDAGIRFALEQETETFCDQLIARNIRPAQPNPVSFLQRDLMSRG